MCNFPYHPPMPPIRIGIIGCGRISGQYLWYASQSPQLQVLACADLDLSIAQAKAAEFHIPTACSVADLLADDRIDLILNITTPLSHAPITLAALRAGKHVYSEKPLAVTRA